jgi:hypothetical protein
MNFEWDEAKRAGNLAKHGLDFADVPKLDWENARILRDDRFPMASRASGVLPI